MAQLQLYSELVIDFSHSCLQENLHKFYETFDEMISNRGIIAKSANYRLVICAQFKNVGSTHLSESLTAHFSRMKFVTIAFTIGGKNNLLSGYARILTKYFWQISIIKM